MKILYLYEMMKLNGPAYNRSKTFTNKLMEFHRVEMKYLVMKDDIYNNFDKSDPGYPEVVSSKEFLDGGYSCVIVDGHIYEHDSVPTRIPHETLKSFHDNGGIICFW